jgi:hypothetical protein
MEVELNNHHYIIETRKNVWNVKLVITDVSNGVSKESDDDVTPTNFIERLITVFEGLLREEAKEYESVFVSE